MAEQQSLFDRDPPPWELDDAREQLVATLVFSRGPQKPFDYAVPEELRGQVAAGQRVRAPFGKQQRPLEGYCVALENRLSGPRPLKELIGVVDPLPLLSPAMLRLTRWMSDYYLCGWGQVLEAVVPAGVRLQAGTRERQFVSLPNHVAARLPQLKSTPTQKRILDVLNSKHEPIEIQRLAEAARCTPAPIQSMRKKGLLTIETRRVDSNSVSEPADRERQAHLELNDDQRRALDTLLRSLDSRAHETILIHGVTGSGKTEVYMQAIQRVVSFGRQAIVLVPEISLTPQTEARFRSRFGRVAVLHSHLNDIERRRHWQRIAAGQVTVVVGARSAIFAPVPNLGLIVLDEEHESSFKQDSAPRYHARDVAIERARAEHIPLVLGSATPSLESWHRAHQGEFRLVSLPRRVFDRPLPAVGTIDLRVEFQDRRNRGAISRQLRNAMNATLAEAGQVILLLNRRGFSTHIQCNNCGLVVECPYCAIALTHHQHEQTALCHYCDYQIPAPDTCPECHFVGIRYSGLGTQRLEAEVKARFPNDRCLRMDTDTMRKPGSHERALKLFHDGEVRILVGTQMIAKGLDFPNVTLVGVINADTALHLPDFRASERTFQLVTQVAGRSGRGEKGGRVLVQTFSPDCPAIVAAAKHDYERFAREELPNRQAHGYPPVGSMVRIVVRGPAERPTSGFAEEVANCIRTDLETAAPGSRVLGPAPAPIAKLRGNFRYQIQIQGPEGALLRHAVRQALDRLKAPDEVQWIADVDPLDML